MPRRLFVCCALFAACSSTSTADEHADAGSRDADATFGHATKHDWPTYRASTYRDGYAQGSVVGDEVSVLFQHASFLRGEWTAVKPSGAVWGDALYYPNDLGTLFAFDRITGEQRWMKTLIDDDPGIHGSPQATESIVCIGEYHGGLHCLDRATGDVVWENRTGTSIGSSPLYVEAHHAFYISHETYYDKTPGGLVTKNDPFTGEELWRSEKLGHYAHSSVAVDPVRNLVLVGSNNGILHAFDASTGKRKWQRDFEPGENLDDDSADIKSTPAISPSRGLVVFGTWDHNVYALDLDTGNTVWTFDTGGGMQGSAAIDEKQGIVYQGTLASGESLFALDLATGEKRWGIDLGRISSSPAISGDRKRVVVGSEENAVIAVEAGTGDIVWRFTTDGPVTSSPVLVDSEIYIAARKGSLYGLRTR